MKTTDRFFNAHSRRSFLRGTLAASLPFAASPLLRAAAPAPSQRLNLAVIGTGGQGSSHAAVWAGVPESRLVAVNPHFPALRSVPMALSGASRRKQIPCSSHSPDGKAYLVAHGASDGVSRRFGYNSWITADEVYLLRVTPTIENMNDPTKYEFFDGTGWTHDFGKIKPIVSWRDRMGCVTMTYNAPLKKYLMCVTDGMTTGRRYNTYILESDTITGPFRMVQYLKEFGEQGYFVNFPSKFISKDGKTLWLSYSGNFATNWDGHAIKRNPPSSRYAWCLHEVKLRHNLAAPHN